MPPNRSPLLPCKHFCSCMDFLSVFYHRLRLRLCLDCKPCAILTVSVGLCSCCKCVLCFCCIRFNFKYVTSTEAKIIVRVLSFISLDSSLSILNLYDIFRSYFHKNLNVIIFTLLQYSSSIHLFIT